MEVSISAKGNVLKLKQENVKKVNGKKYVQGKITNKKCIKNDRNTAKISKNVWQILWQY